MSETTMTAGTTSRMPDLRECPRYTAACARYDDLESRLTAVKAAHAEAKRDAERLGVSPAKLSRVEIDALKLVGDEAGLRRAEVGERITSLSHEVAVIERALSHLEQERAVARDRSNVRCVAEAKTLLRLELKPALAAYLDGLKELERINRLSVRLCGSFGDAIPVLFMGKVAGNLSSTSGLTTMLEFLAGQGLLEEDQAAEFRRHIRY